MFRKSCESLVILAGLCLCLLLPTCATQESGPVEATRKAPPGGSRVPEDALKKHGLEELWYNPADSSDTAVQLVELSADGLFIATQPVAGRKGRLKLVNRSNGHPEWIIETDEALKTAPSVYRYPPGTVGKPNEVYLSQLDTVLCIDLKYGDRLWKQEVPFPISSRVVADDLAYFVGSDNGRAYGLQKKSSIEDWTYRSRSAIKASPVVGGGAVFVASTDGSVYRFTARTGFVKGSSWEFRTGARVVSDPVLFSRWVLVGSTDYKLYCLEMQDGAVAWSFPAEGPIEDTPVVFSYRPNQEFAYCVAVRRTNRAEERTLFSVKMNGKEAGQEAWRRAGVRKIVSMGKSLLYVITDPASSEERSLLAVDILTGEEKFRIPLEGFSFVPINTADFGRNLKERGRIYLVAEDGTVQVIGERL